MKKILEFNYKDKKLVLFINKSNLIYQKVKKGVLTNNLEKDELELINKVLIKLIPSKNIKNLGYIKYDNKKINYLYDLDNNFYIFHEDNKITLDCLVLNKIFNNQDEYLVLKDEEDSKDLDFIRRNVKVGKLVLSVLISSSLLLSSSMIWIKGGQKVINLIDYYKAEYAYQEGVLEYNDRQIELDEIINAINNNVNLTNEEKKFFLSKSKFFIDNLEYFDYYTVIDNLKRLKIQYIEETKGGTYGEFTVNGNNRGLIKIYGVTSFKDTSKYALSHEFLHAFTKYNLVDNYFYEILNVVLNNEYFGDDTNLYDNGYEVLREYFYIMAELVDARVLRKYHANNDINYLKNDLIEIIPDFDMATDLLNNLNIICKIEMLKNTDYSKYLKLEQELKMKKQQVMTSLKTYYEVKYQTSIENDLNILFWFDYSKCSVEIANKLNFDDNTLRCVDDYVRIKQFKKIFNKTGNDNLVLSLASKVEENTRNYTLDELLGTYFKRKEDINLPMNPDGTYVGVTYKPISYIDYEVTSFKHELNK